MRIDPKALSEIATHAEETFPDECCGVVLALPDRTQKVVRIRNVQDEMHASDPKRYPRTARDAYTGEPGELLVALERAERPGHRLLAFYHSHPEHDAYFSEEDLAQATPFGEPSYPEASQIVISVLGGKAEETKVFSWSEKEGSYVEAELG